MKQRTPAALPTCATTLLDPPQQVHQQSQFKAQRATEWRVAVPLAQRARRTARLAHHISRFCSAWSWNPRLGYTGCTGYVLASAQAGINNGACGMMPHAACYIILLHCMMQGLNDSYESNQFLTELRKQGSDQHSFAGFAGRPARHKQDMI